ncbi:MAG: glycosyltransferase family 2 protein [Planctomycetota bacterium]|nr:glycosyltransferase family 2 protein [Planctomycetota bacterium]
MGTTTLQPPRRWPAGPIHVELPPGGGPALAGQGHSSQAQALKCLILVPAFNESQSVGKLVRRLNRLLPGYDVLVIDDGSTDDTVRQVPPGTAVVSLPFNLGIGGAMQTGYRYADLNRYDVAVQVDGDGQHRPSEVCNLVAALQSTGADLVLGSRFLARKNFKQSLTRMTGIRVLSTWIRILCGLKITDCTSGFRAVNRRVIQAYAHWYPEDYPEPEVVLLLHRSKFKVVEIPARMRRRMYGKSSISLARGLFYVLKVGICLALDTIRQPWPSGKIDGL